MTDGDNVTLIYEAKEDDIIWRIEFGSVTIKGYLVITEAETLRTELTKAINKARKG